MIYRTLAASALLVSVAAGPASANLITNGDFATDGSGWTYVSGFGGHQGGQGNPPGSFWINHNGTNVDGSNPDPKLSQGVSTGVGGKYTLTFDYRAWVIGGLQGLAVDIDGVETATYDLLSAAWQTETLSCIASNTTTDIAFRAEINGTDYDALIDNVSVVRDAPQVPVPAAGLLGLAGLSAFGLLGWRRKNQP